MTQPRTLPLHDRHAALGARFAPFAGWNMPTRYGAIRDEHMAVREHAGLFDVSHMGEVFVRGPGAAEAVDRVVTNRIADLAPGRAVYTMMCRPDGGIVDDLIVYRLADDEVLICVNAGNRDKDVAWLRDHVDGAELTDETDDWCQLAIQGPDARDIVHSALGEVIDVAPFGVASLDRDGVRLIVARTGYTGEDGYEIYVPATHAGPLFDALVDAGGDRLTPCGLGARDSLRLEARLALYGNDIDEQTNPFEAGLAWTVKLDKGEFVGRDALLAIKERGPARRYRGFVLEGRGMLRGGYEIWSGDRRVGVTTSGSLAFTMNEVPIATGYLDSDVADLETVDIDIRGRRVPARVVRSPFYRRDA